MWLTPSTYISGMVPENTDTRPYHHGDLRAALLATALDLLRARGPAGLTLRGVARAAGVSRTAPYRHFQDRRELVAAVAAAAFGRMGRAIGQAVQEGSPGLPALRRGLAAYIAFAEAHPAEYRVMFGPEVAGRDGLPELEGAALGVFDILRGGIARLQQRGLLGEGDAGTMAIAAWATLHGLSMLSLDGQTAVTGRGIEALTEEATELLLRGMGAPARE